MSEYAGVDGQAPAADSGPAMLHTIPAEIRYDESALTIEWKDGVSCAYDLLSLRRNCPCAQCRGGHDADAVRTTGHIANIRLVSWKKVGRYALQLTWSDNHDTGIYTYDSLREACDRGEEYRAPDQR